MPAGAGHSAVYLTGKRRRGDSNPRKIPLDDTASCDCPKQCPTLIARLNREAELALFHEPSAASVILIEAISRLKQIEAKPREESHAG